jgi:hypothetical protein
VTKGDVKLHHNYYVTVAAGDISHTIFGKLVSLNMGYKGVRYWMFMSQAMYHLIDPEDIEEIEEVRTIW